MKNYLNKTETTEELYLENLDRAINETKGIYRERLMMIKQDHLSSNQVSSGKCTIMRGRKKQLIRSSFLRI